MSEQMEIALKRLGHATVIILFLSIKPAPVLETELQNVVYIWSEYHLRRSLLFDKDTER